MARIICMVPFVYEANYREKNQKKDRQQNVRAEHAVGVRVLDPADFPVALMASDTGRANRYGQVDEVRWDGESFYRPFTYEPSGARYHLDKSVLDGDDHRSPFSYYGRTTEYNHRGGIPLKLEEVPGQVQSSDRLERTGILETVADRIVVCDGVLWAKCGEPAYVWEGNRLMVEFVNPAEIKSPMNTVRADGLDDWCAVMSPGQRPVQREHVRGHLEVLMPEVLRLRPEGPALLACAEAVFRYAEHGNFLPDLDVDAFVAYAGLRDTMKSAEGKASPELAQALGAFNTNPFWIRQFEHLPVAGHVSRYLATMVGNDDEARPAPGR